jgi:SAM (Sterile alpha motif) domain-containing protein
MDLGGWLRSLGLGQYEAAFRENAIDDTVLPNLTAEDLKDLGVGIVGHRRKLLDAIAALRADASAKAPPPDALPATDITAKDTAERRQVTVMFSDLVGSTAQALNGIQDDWKGCSRPYHKSWPSSQFGLCLPSKPVWGSSGESYRRPVAEEVRAAIMSSRQWPPNTRIERCYGKNNKQVRKAEGS